MSTGLCHSLSHLEQTPSCLPCSLAIWLLLPAAFCLCPLVSRSWLCSCLECAAVASALGPPLAPALGLELSPWLPVLGTFQFPRSRLCRHFSEAFCDWLSYISHQAITRSPHFNSLHISSHLSPTPKDVKSGGARTLPATFSLIPPVGRDLTEWLNPQNVVELREWNNWMWFRIILGKWGRGCWKETQYRMLL